MIITPGNAIAAASCKVYRSAALAIATASETTIDWDAEVFDTNAFHDNSTNPSRLTVPAGLDGVYLVGAAAGGIIVDNVNERFILRLYKNGTELAGGRYEGTGSGASTEPGGQVSTIVSLAATDYVTATVFHQRGSNGDLRVGTSGSAFWLVRLAATP